MTERMSNVDFLRTCGGVANGYVLHPGQKHPDTYQELVEFMVDRLDIDEAHASVAGLREWWSSGSVNPDSCSPDIDMEHVSAVLLIGELPDPDDYVARLPADTEGVMLPAPDLLRLYLAQL